jgi:hypothetical protein
MKHNYTLLRSFSIIIFLFPIVVFSTNYPFSKWIKNLSEGDQPMGWEEFNPEIKVKGNNIHALWFTLDKTISSYGDHVINYRRSTDNGNSWHQVQEITRVQRWSDLDSDKRENRLLVSDNYVHIFYIKKNDEGKEALFQKTSKDYGQTFSDEVQLFTEPSYWGIDDLRVSGDGPKINIIFRRDCSGCGGIPTIKFFHSDDYGETFIEREVPDTYKGYHLRSWDIKTQGSSIYFITLKPIGPYYNYDYELYLIQSYDDGLTFSDVLLSEPSKDGIHHVFYGMDSDWGYLDKISIDGNRVGVAWFALDAEDKYSIYAAVSDDNGRTFTKINKVASDIRSIFTGHESIVINGENVFVSFLTSDSRVHYCMSQDGGSTYSEVAEFTEPTNGRYPTMWGPTIKKDPVSDGAYIIGTGPVVGKVGPSESKPSTYFLGNMSLATRKSVLEIDQEGNLHLLYVGGSAFLGTGGFSDWDIFYRKLEMNPITDSEEDHVLHLDNVPNKNDGSGAEEFDNMTVPWSESLHFKDAMTIEFWVKPEQLQESRLLSQFAKSSNNAWNPRALQIWTDRYNPSQIVCGIMTESGPYVLNKTNALTKDYWTHLALTYDKNSVEDNYRLYVNGQKVASTMASGELITDIAPWVLGATDDNFTKQGFIGDYDELRFWSKALSQQEIQSRIYGPLVGNEEGLAAYYNFDAISDHGQITDQSGNSNHGYLMYQETLVPSTIEEVNVTFDYFQQGTEVYFTQLNSVCDSSVWNFGDDAQSGLANPQHIYPGPGVYNVTLHAFCGEMSASISRAVTIEGIDRVYPKIGGNKGTATIRIYGGGFNESSLVVLKNGTREDIEAMEVNFVEPDLLLATFDLFDRSIGEYELEVRNGSNSIIADRSFEVEEGEEPEAWANITGPQNVLLNKWTEFSINYGNETNQDAYLVPFKLHIKGVDIETVDLDFIDIQFDLFPWLDNPPDNWIKNLLPYVPVEEESIEPHYVYPMIIPHIPSGVKDQIRLRIRTKDEVSVRLETSVTGPLTYTVPRFEGDTAVWKGLKCFIQLSGKILTDAVFSEADEALQCLKDIYATASGDFDVYQPNRKGKVYSDISNLSLLLANCGVAGAKVVGKAAFISNPVYLLLKNVSNLNTMFGYYNDLLGCIDHLIPGAKNGIIYAVLTSFDPNEKYGPSGKGGNNHIYPPEFMNYRISFENKSDATAPAQQVFIYDTLDVSMLDTASISFASAGFGDTIIYVNPEAKTLAADIDLRPDKDIIVRITGALDNNGTVKWEFTTLDPETMQLTDDALGGFLPPNVNAPEGEGFVSFNIGLKQPIVDGDQVTNEATIVFDYNEPIYTDPFVNVFDLRAPTSSIVADKTTYADTLAELQIEGADGGSGIDYYFIYVSKDEGAFEFYKIVDTSAFSFIGELEHEYQMFSVAVDHAGNVEEDPAIADVNFRLSVGTEDFGISSQDIHVFPIPAKDHINLNLDNITEGHYSISVSDLYGKKIKSIYTGHINKDHFSVKTDLNLVPGVYLITIRNGIGYASKKLIVQ